MRKKNLQTRRAGALQRLKNAKFFEKNYRSTGKARTQEDWQARVDEQIATLEKLV
jgi:hypothetical protein